jgi:hypothetical protein
VVSVIWSFSGKRHHSRGIFGGLAWGPLHASDGEPAAEMVKGHPGSAGGGDEGDHQEHIVVGEDIGLLSELLAEQLQSREGALAWSTSVRA